MFRKLGDFDIEAENFGGSANERVLILRLVGGGDGDDVWEQVAGTRIVLVGGWAIKQELKRLLIRHGRPALDKMIPGGINGRTHTNMRRFVGL